MQRVLKYLELKSGYSDNGPAWVAKVGVSKSGRTLYFNGKAPKRGQAIAGNHFDLETGEVYWVSNVKRDGLDRHWAGSGRVLRRVLLPSICRLRARPSLTVQRSMLSQIWSRRTLRSSMP